MTWLNKEVFDETTITCYHCLIIPGPHGNGLMYSLDACYTPAQGEGPCKDEEILEIENEVPRNVI
jgi:hypothetical protein